MIDVWNTIQAYQAQYEELKQRTRLFIEKKRDLDSSLCDEIFQQMLFMKFSIYVLRGHAGDVSVDKGENISPVCLADALFTLGTEVSNGSLTIEEDRENFHFLFSESYTKVLNMISL
jgi:hypothetical protein